MSEVDPANPAATSLNVFGAQLTQVYGYRSKRLLPLCTAATGLTLKVFSVHVQVRHATGLELKPGVLSQCMFCWIVLAAMYNYMLHR